VGPFDEHGKVVAPLFQRYDQIAVLLEAASSLQDFLGVDLIFPEIGRGGARLEAGQLLLRASGFKDSSANRSRVCSGLRSGASGLRRSA
jgi:hypothetical protein